MGKRTGMVGLAMVAGLLAGCSTQATTSDPWPAPEPKMVTAQDTWAKMSPGERVLLCAEYDDLGWEVVKDRVGGAFVEGLHDKCDAATTER